MSFAAKIKKERAPTKATIQKLVDQFDVSDMITREYWHKYVYLVNIEIINQATPQELKKYITYINDWASSTCNDGDVWHDEMKAETLSFRAKCIRHYIENHNIDNLTVDQLKAL